MRESVLIACMRDLIERAESTIACKVTANACAKLFFARNMTFIASIKSVTHSNETMLRVDQVPLRSDQGITHSDQGIAHSDQTIMRRDHGLIAMNRSFARSDGACTRFDRTFTPGHPWVAW